MMIINIQSAGSGATQAYNFAPYILWSFVFTSIGKKIIEKKEAQLQKKIEKKGNTNVSSTTWICENCGNRNNGTDAVCFFCGQKK